ncbi:sulfite exporter TauE/SafE family protein [Desulfurobacterium sp.]
MLSHIVEAGIVLSVAGFLIGFLSGLLGKGGGMLFVPTFWVIFPLLGISESIVPKSAVATSLACMTVTSGTSAWQHIRKGFLKGKLFFFLVSGALPGVFLGSALTAEFLSPQTTKVLFAIFLIFMSVKLLKGSDSNKKKEKIDYRAVFLTGIASGFLAGLLGVGGGAVVTPMLYSFGNIPIKIAMATSTGVVFFNALFSSLNYIYYGWHRVSNPFFIGYIYVPALIFMIPGLYVGTRFGVKIMHRVHPDKLRKWFALFLLAVAVEVVVEVFNSVF